MANRYEGKSGKGAARHVKALKRQEAEARNLSYSLNKALDSSAAGDVKDLGDFRQYADSGE
jgi:hypothetical protein